MRRKLLQCSASSRAVLDYLVYLRHQRPQLFIGIAAAYVMLVALIAIALVGIGGQDDPETSLSTVSQQPQAAVSTTSESQPTVRLVPDSGSDDPAAGVAESSPQTAEQAAQADAGAESVALPTLSEVLNESYRESELIYGSDGSEGSLLPIDNGVVPSSGPRFETHWELILPSAGIQAAVVQVGLTPDGAMGSTDNPFVIGWLSRSASPGEPGNALLGGHRDYQDRDGNVDVGVCWQLDQTRVGDQLIMHNQSTDRYYVFDVVDTATIRPESEEAVRYLRQTQEPVVTLITCSGAFDRETHSYAERIVVVALLNAVATPDA